MQLKVKFFDELTATEIYEILRARAEIFVVEQNINYQDMDRTDYDSLHVFYEEDGKVLAYLRAYLIKSGVVRIGRVLTIEHGKGLGGKLLSEGIKAIRQAFSPEEIYVESQKYATGFYAREGFAVCSEEFMDEGIPHIGMTLNLS